MKRKRKSFDAVFKAKVALEAVKGERTLSEISSRYGVHANQVTQWKKQLLDGIPEIFSRRKKKEYQPSEELQDELYKQIGQLKVELDWLKKKSEQIG